MFDLENAIVEWREASAEHVPAEALEELEAHLRDGIEARIEEGEKPEEALILMVHQIGDPKVIGKELVRESGKRPAGPSRSSGHRSPVVGLLVGLGVAIFALFVAECFLAYQNKQYRSFSRFELLPMRSTEDIRLFETAVGRRELEPLELDVATELQVLLGGEVIDQVVRELKLAERWQVVSTEARARVETGASVQKLGQSRVVELSYRDHDPALSAEIVNALVGAYRSHKWDLWQNRHQLFLDALGREIKAKRDRVEEGRLRMLDLGDRYRITPSESAHVEEGERRAFEAYTAAKVEASQAGQAANIWEGRLERKRVLLEKARDDSLDYRRRSADYDDARRRYEMDRETWQSMQLAYDRAQILLRMPLRPVEVHSKAEVATRPQPISWFSIWSGVFTKGWFLIAGVAALSWYFSVRPRRRKPSSFLASPFPIKVAKGGKKDADEEISWA